MHSRLAVLIGMVWVLQGCGTPTGGAQVPTLPAGSTPAGETISPAVTLSEPGPDPTAAAPGSDPNAAAPGPALLPAAVYFLAEDEQIWRVAADATTLTQITSEAGPVVEFDVSPLDGSLIFITANSLVQTDAMGGGRTVLVAGPPPPAEPDEQWYGAAFSDPLWSPDGKSIAYASNGVHLYSLDGGSSTLLLPSDPFPTDFSDTPELIQFYRPAKWSPDGSRLLINVSYFPEGGSLRVLNLSDGSQIDITNPDGYVCCYPSWSKDGLNVYFANDTAGMYGSGLWRADVISGTAVTLIAGEESGAFSLVAHPYEASDGQLYTFMATTPALPEGFVPLTMTRSAADGVTGRAALRTDSYILADILWDPAGRGAVIADMSAQIMSEGYAAEVSNPLVWLPSDDSPALPLPALGSVLHWGK